MWHAWNKFEIEILSYLGIWNYWKERFQSIFEFNDLFYFKWIKGINLKNIDTKMHWITFR